jgi:dTMP kinase
MSGLTSPHAPQGRQPSARQAATLSRRAPDTDAGGPGFFAAIDGPSGVGKTTVTELASGELAACGLPVLATRQPSDSPLGLLARSATHDLRGLPLTYLMAADRHHHYEHVIRPAVEAGHVVVCDRYVATALVLDQVDGADPDFVWGLYRSLGWPDLAVILAGDPPVSHARAQRRGVYSRFHEGGLAAAEAEASLYEGTAAMLAGLGYPVQIITVGDRSAGAVAAQVSALILSRMNDPQSPPRERTTGH